MEKDRDHDDIGDVSASLQVLLAQPTKRDQYHALSRSAAILERGKNYVAASQQWLAASDLATASVDRHWCEARAHLCDRLMLLSGYTK
ncbi:ANR family transcriptional regulator [Serratia sp. 2723]|uniref:ANR family transcriptional regulator n=1 Tax=unclassified Serratia (in: enterobacteria) TaxID=2647522 RepID=UPI003D1E6421